MCVCLSSLIKRGDEIGLPNLGRSRKGQRTHKHTHMQTHTHPLGLHPGICCDLALEAENSTGWPFQFPPVSQYLLSNWLLMSEYVCVCVCVHLFVSVYECGRKSVCVCVCVTG